MGYDNFTTIAFINLPTEKKVFFFILNSALCKAHGIPLFKAYILLVNILKWNKYTFQNSYHEFTNRWVYEFRHDKTLKKYKMK